MNFKKLLLIFICFALSVLFTGCIFEDTSDNVLSNQTGQPPLYTALAVVNLLKIKDMEGLKEYMHPENGVRLTPYGNVDASGNQVFEASQMTELLLDPQVYDWGLYDGSGEPIQLTFSDYYEQFIYDEDFANPHLIGNNVVVGRGNSLINITEVYPDAVFIEFHFTGFNPQYDGMDWKSLRLVFEQSDTMWYLSGIIHDQWTI